ncbi:MAG: glutamine--fructose-6-phosphate transaminase (isomerizing) [Gammaproteobacteria bacterium]|nr:MAG: glutamine--fructose-6-phosphate transaminase (isomerizing) [Gammaproteobacteria bacterium]
MCGIVGAIAQRNIVEILLEGLKRLEYRGYDSAGLSIIRDNQLYRERQVGKVKALVDAVNINSDCFHGKTGIAHTRWATHGEPAQHNAHPHVSGKISVVHNGIVENFAQLKQQMIDEGYQFTSETDTEVVVHLIHHAYQTTQDLLKAVELVVPKLHGAFALGVIHADHPDELITVRLGSPLVIGVGIGENFIASDQLALLPVTNRFIYLEEGDIARLTCDHVEVFADGKLVNRAIKELDAQHHNADKGEFKHYMLKEIYEQPDAVSRTLDMGITTTSLKPEFLDTYNEKLKQVRHVQILACGTSYHSGLVAKYWFEQLTRLPCSVEIASEFRYRYPVVCDDTLLICISQSGETADTLSALRAVQKMQNDNDIQGLQTLALCNVPTSSMVRETDIYLPTQAGVEIGVASTKAFTTQLVALMLLVLKVGSLKQRIEGSVENHIIRQMHKLSGQLYQTINLDKTIKRWAEFFEGKTSTIFLGRNSQFPIALEGALKLKEISYIHAEGYAAGELKHGPLALIDKEMPVIVLAPKDGMLDKLKANMQEVHARHGELFVFTSEDAGIQEETGIHVIYIPEADELLAPIVYSIPVQLLSYHIAVSRGTDVDQPRNLAKSVTVE